MSSGKGNDLLARLKKINCASLPPCSKTLLNHIKRAQYVARMWRRADETNPTGEASPTDYGWKLNQLNQIGSQEVPFQSPSPPLQMKTV